MEVNSSEAAEWSETMRLKSENEALRDALSRVLLDIDFLVEAGTLSDIRNDMIYANARKALCR